MELLGAGPHAKLGVGKDISELAGKEGGMKAEPMMAMKQPDKDVLQQLDSDVRLPPSNGPMMGFPPGSGGEVDVKQSPIGLDGSHHPMVNNHIPGPQPGGPPPSGVDQMPPGALPPHMMGPGGPLPPQQQPHQRGGGQFIPPESPFMQQHSQIFVFSTDLANQAAAAVCQGQCKSIIDFHLDQPGIKDMLQKQPMKLMAQGQPPMLPPGMFPGNMGMRGDGGPMPGGPMMKGGPPVMGPGGPGEPDMSSVEQWVQQQNNHLQQGNYQQMAMQQMGANNMPPNNPYLQPGPGMPSWPPESISPHGLSPADDFLGGPPQMVGPGGPHPMGGPGGFGPGGPQHRMPPGGGGGLPPHMNLQQSKVPNENLTPEQLQRREEGLANIRKLQQMLLPEQQLQSMPGGPPVADMMGPGGPMMGGPQPGGPPMMGPPLDMMHAGSPMGMMGGPMPPHGQSPINMPPFGGGGMRGVPPNWDSLSMEQREWYKVQQEYFADKMRKQQMESMHYQQMQPMGMGPQRHPSPFYPGMPQHRGLMDSMSPSSPSFNGPMPPHPGLDPRMSPMPGESPDFMRPGMMPRGMPGGHMNNFGPGMPSMHPVGFDPTMEPSITDFMFPPDDVGKMGGGAPMMRNLPPMMRAGNPEQFHPELIGGPGGMPGMGVGGAVNGPKAPPAYSNKRKRSGEDMDELYKKLQPAPSPQQFSYLNQFEGQELTITRQLNLAYQESSNAPNNVSSPLVSSQTQPPTPVQQPPLPDQQQPVPSPASRNGTTANRSTPVSAAASPLAATTSSVNATTVASSLPAVTSSASLPLLQTSQRTPAGMHDGAQHAAGSGKSSLTANITSSSLEKLAKGVEQLSNQMQQSLSQGGPFHNVQAHTPGGSDLPSTPVPLTPASASSQQPSLGAPQPGNQLPPELQASMGGASNQSPVPGQNHAGYMSGPNGFDPVTKFGPGPGMGGRQMPLPTGNGGPTPPMGSSGFSGSPQGGMLSPGYQRPLSGSTIGNANVQIQPKAPNTIQYMPVTNASGPGAPPMNRLPQMMMKDFDMAPRMPSPGPDRPMMVKRNSYSPGPPDMMMGPRMPMQGQSQMGMPPQMMMQGGGGMPYGSPGPVPVHMQGRPPSPMMNCPPDMYPMQQHMPMPGGGMMMGPGGPIRPDMGPVMGGPNGGGPGGGPNPAYSYQFQQFQQQLYAQNRPRPYGLGMGGGPGPGMGGMLGGPMGRPDMMEPDMGPGMMMGMGGGRMMGPGGPMPGMGGPPMGMNMLPNMP